MAKVFALTLNWNGADKLERLSESLINSLSDIDYEWIVKDNNSNDNSIEYLESLQNDRIKIIKYPNNLQNFSAGVNLCFKEAAPKDDDLILLLNNDIIFNDTASIKNMISLLKEDVGVVGAKLLYTNTNKLQHAGVVFEPFHKAPIHFRANQIADEHSDKNRLFQAVTGAVLLLRAGDFRNINRNSGNFGLSEELFWAFDDIDLCLSVHYDLNKKIVYCGKTNIFHDESASLKKNPVNRMFMSQNINYLRNKWNGRYKIDRLLYEQDPKYNLFE